MFLNCTPNPQDGVGVLLFMFLAWTWLLCASAASSFSHRFCVRAHADLFVLTDAVAAMGCEEHAPNCTSQCVCLSSVSCDGSAVPPSQWWPCMRSCFLCLCGLLR
ncbi:hypothetical protein TRVL_01918 [Trypanosoma vivax]|nr:hypothetical protein TRVL_01918 [Trypanosoma vivax]